jgi:CBS domain containing-hemolysin-like protein
MSTGWAIVLSLLLLAGNGFFVAAEFALVASKSYRLERSAARGSRAARSALEGTRELSLMLAGAQLGITVCTLGLGALAEPAIAHLIEPVLHAIGLPSRTSYVIAFIIGLIVVVFLHMVVGEMAPKSWAISHPERSAILLAPPFRSFTRLVRPILAGLNAMSNGLLWLARVQPQDRLAQAHGPEELAILLEQSRARGTIEPAQHELLARMLRLRQKTIRQIMQPIGELVTVAPASSGEDIERTCLHTGRSRLAVSDSAGRPLGIVHVRDAVRATTSGRRVSARELMSEPFHVQATSPLLDAVARMRDQRAQIAIVDDNLATVGFISFEDLVEEIIGDFDDETDHLASRGLRRR